MQLALDHLTMRAADTNGAGIARRVQDYLTPRLAAVAARVAAATPDADVWVDCDKLHADVGDCIAGVMAVESGFAEAAADVTRWLDELSAALGAESVRLVIPAPREWLDTDASIVRLRFAGDGVLGLPVAAHEYGHFVATQITQRVVAADDVPDVVHVFEEELRKGARSAERPAVYWKGHELFADAFATWVTGPAYVWYCRIYRFHTAVTEAPDHRHPPGYLRLRTMAAVLQSMATDDPTGSVAAAAQVLAPRLAAAVEADVPPGDAWLIDLGETMVRLVTTSQALRPVAYTGADHVAARDLASGSTTPAMGVQRTPIVLNALWERQRTLLAPASGPAPEVSS